jgi:hypothetical protein
MAAPAATIAVPAHLLDQLPVLDAAASRPGQWKRRGKTREWCPPEPLCRVESYACCVASARKSGPQWVVAAFFALRHDAWAFYTRMPMRPGRALFFLEDIAVRLVRQDTGEKI